MGRMSLERDYANHLMFNAGKELIGKCRGCGTTRRLAIAPLARRYGGKMHILQLSEKFVCQHCGKKGVPLQYVGWEEPDPVHFRSY